MEERQYLGLDPFAPPCDIVDPGPLPIYPILAAKNTVDALLAEEDSVRKLLRLGLPTGKLQLPPEINLSLFERISEALPAEAPALLAAAKAYTRDAYDCNELAEFCRRKKKAGGTDVEVAELAEGSLAAAKRCSASLAVIVALLPSTGAADEARRARNGNRNF